MNYVVFDIESQEAVGPGGPEELEIAVISVYEKNTDEIKSFLIEDFSEMWPIFERADAIVGYNSDSFDIPLLNKYYGGDLTHIKSIDLMNAIKDSLGYRPKLDNVAAGTLGRNKSGHGLEAVEWWKKGEIEKIKKYCEEDVLITKQIYEYIVENKSIKVKDKFSDKVVEVDVDTHDWDNTSDNPSITKSMF